MNKLTKVSIVVAVLLSILFVVLTNIRKGTYSIDNGTNVTLECPTTIKAGAIINCNVYLNISNDDVINGISAVYDLPTGITYRLFSPSMSCPENDTTCIGVYSENGFVIGNIAQNMTSRTLLGIVQLNVDSSLAVDSVQTITLKEITLSNDELNYIDLSNATTSFTIIEDIQNTDIEFDSSLAIDEANNIVKSIEKGTLYTSIISKINNATSITITDKDDAVVTNTSKAKTGDKISISSSSGTVVYTISVIGDVTGDGNVNMNDVTAAYRHFANKTIITDTAKFISGNIAGSNDKINMNDVTKIYRIFRNMS